MKLSPNKPKDPDAWGLGTIAQEALKIWKTTGHKELYPVIGVMRIRDYKGEGNDGERPVEDPIMEFPRLEAITLPELKRAARAIIEQQATDRRGIIGGTLPYGERELLDESFGWLYRDTVEAAIDDRLTENDRLRHHMEVVHKEDHETAFDASIEWVRVEHAKAHDSADGLVWPHERDWLGWTALDLAVAESWADDTAVTAIVEEARDDLAAAVSSIEPEYEAVGPMNTEDRIVAAAEEPDDDAGHGDDWADPDHEDVAVDFDAEAGESVLAADDRDD